MSPSLSAIVLAAGEGTRLPGPVPKVLVPIWGRPALVWPVLAARSLDPARVLVVAGVHRDAIVGALAPYDVAPEDVILQDPALGTGHAVSCAAQALDGVAGQLLVMYGDGPLIRPEVLEALLAEHRGRGAELTVLTVRLPDPTGYGRVVRDAEGLLASIVEQADADDATQRIDEINTGVMVLSLPDVFEDLAALDTDNSQGEVYLTDLAASIRARGGTVAAFEWGQTEDVLGFNDHRELALVRRILRERILTAHAVAGVEIVDPDTTFIDADVTIEPGVRILPCTVIEGRTTIGAGCEVGPFSHLRTGTVLEPGAEVGNFTETKQTTLGAGSKAKHLTYLGDTVVGPASNIGAGTITANYDGTHKHVTTMGAGVFIGSGSVIVAPARLGDGASTGAGAIVTARSDVPPGDTWVGVPARPLRKTQPSEPSS